MTELEKLDAGLEYDFWDEEVNGRKLRAIRMCQKLNAISQNDEAAREPVIRELLGLPGKIPVLAPISTATTGCTSQWGRIFSPTTT